MFPTIVSNITIVLNVAEAMMLASDAELGAVVLVLSIPELGAVVLVLLIDISRGTVYSTGLRLQCCRQRIVFTF